MADEQQVAKEAREALQRELLEAKGRLEAARTTSEEVRTNLFNNALSGSSYPPELVEAENLEFAARAEVDRIQRRLDDTPTTEDILADLGPDADRAAVAATVGGGSRTPAEEHEETNRRNRGALVALALAGSALAAGILLWLFSQDQGGVGQSPQPTRGVAVTSDPPSPTIGSSLATGTSGPTLLATATPSPTVVATATTYPSVAPTISPLDTRPATGDSPGIATFNRTSGRCDFPDSFSSAFHLLADDGAATLTQLPDEHITSGTLTRDSASGGLLITSAAGQDYNTTVSGNTVNGTYTDTTNSCNDVFDLHLVLDRPFMAPPPFEAAPAHFTFEGPDGPVLDLPVGVPLRIGVSSYGDPVIQHLLPIRVEMHVGSETPWNFTIGSGSGDDALCPTPISCAADAPTPAADDWFGPDQQPVLVAFGGGNDVLAVYAPQGIHFDEEWLLDLIASGN